MSADISLNALRADRDKARILADAASDLLAALRQITEAIEARNYFAAENAVGAARAAIAKAEGKT